MPDTLNLSSDADLFSDNLTRPVYKLRQIKVAAFLGGPLAATCMIARNFKTFDQPEWARKTWLYGVCGTILYVIVALSIPAKISFLHYVFTIGLIYGADAIVKKWQGDYIDEHLGQGGIKRSGWNCVGVILISVLCLGVIMSPYIIYIALRESPQIN